MNEGSAVLGLASGLAEWSCSLQRLPRVGPAIGMSTPFVVFVHVVPERGFEGDGRDEVAVGQKLPPQHGEPQFDLVEPTPVLGHVMEPQCMRRVGEKRT